MPYTIERGGTFWWDDDEGCIFGVIRLGSNGQTEFSLRGKDSSVELDWRRGEWLYSLVQRFDAESGDALEAAAALLSPSVSGGGWRPEGLHAIVGSDRSVEVQLRLRAASDGSVWTVDMDLADTGFRATRFERLPAEGC